MQRDGIWKHTACVLGKTTVIVRKINLLNLSKRKRKEGKEKERIEVKERGRQWRGAEERKKRV